MDFGPHPAPDILVLPWTHLSRDFNVVRCYAPIQIHTLEKNFLTTHMLNLTVSAHCGLEAVNYKATVVKSMWEPKILGVGTMCVLWAGSVKSHAQRVQALLHLGSKSMVFGTGLAYAGSWATLRTRLFGSQISTQPCLSSVLPALFLEK